MTKSGPEIVRQTTLLDLLQRERMERAERQPGRLCVSARLLAAVRLAIRRAPKSRESLADEMSEATGQTVTVHHINNWTAESHPHRMPAELVPALCVATGCDEPLRVLAEAAGVFTLPGPDALRAEIRKLDEEAAKLRAERRRREVFLKEMEG